MPEALRSRQIRIGFMLVALLLAAGAAALGGTEEAQAPVVTSPVTTAASTSSSVAPTTTTLPPRFPLTGHLAPDAAERDRAAVSVKIDNVSQARPQAGLDRADVIYEEFTEGVTRLIVTFQSTHAEVIGPVRSVRPADPGILISVGGVFGFSGGSPAAVDLARGAPLTLVTEGNLDVMYRRGGRAAPHNLYSSTGGLLSKAPEGTGPPLPFADFVLPGSTFAAEGAAPVARVDLAPAPYLTAAYDWNGETGTWWRTTDGSAHFVEGGARVAPTNVILQFTPYSIFPADSAVQYPEIIGTGEAWILSGGHLVKGSWTKPTVDVPTAFADASGAPINLLPGQTWVHLLSPGTFVAFS